MRKCSIAKLSGFDAEYVLGRSYVVGIDEAGRGALAGPVVAAAMAVSSKAYSSEKFLEAIQGLDDSKKLSHHQREELFVKLHSLKEAGYIDFEASQASVEEIEKVNILNATQLAMGRAAEALNLRLNLGLRSSGAVATLFGERAIDTSRAFVLIDGTPMKKFPYAHFAVVKGDSSSLAISAASIIAKVTRDKLMEELSAKYPRYSFDIHKGYGTPAHLQALMLYGPSQIHRPSFLKKLRAEPTKKSEQTELF